MEWQVHTTADTAAVARELLASLTPQTTATVIALHGDLGAGKTTFVQALAAHLGVRESITSPTFVIQKDYHVEGEWDHLVHIDAYRLDDPAELARLGFGELCATPRTLICIEWAERVTELLPADTVHLSFTLVDRVRIISQYHA
jgi:tRNA threonylcarbamoyladenosine biosynthesis protein TsaE